ncbi:MAG: hypothetical protein ACP5QF_06940 [Desulfurella sp.]|uniref:hypothetical protein n=1 Tax=Desulfurella sp. TaxID=1962857 RepID=UPI003D0FCDF3
MIKLDVEVIPKTPIHIGYLRYGFINKVRYYVPGFTLNGAINSALYLSYKKQSLKDVFFCSTFMFYENDKLLEEENIKKYFLFSKTSTQIDNTRRTAKEGRLFNIEFISPTSKVIDENAPKQLTLKGSIFLKDEKFKEELITILKSGVVKVGGEIKHGFGKVEFVIIKESEISNDYKITVKENEKLGILVKYNQEYADFIDGKIDVIFTRRTHYKIGYGLRKSYKGVFFSPFSIAKKDLEFNLSEFI